MSTPIFRSRRGLPTALAAAGATAVVLVLGGCGAPASPSAASAAPTASAFLGSWNVDTGTERGVPPGPKLVTFFADGNVVLSEPASLMSQNGAGVEFLGPGQGSYTVSGDTAHFVAHVLVADIEGTPTGRAVVTGDVRPGADGTLTGPVAIDRIHPDGSTAEPAQTVGTFTRVVR